MTTEQYEYATLKKKTNKQIKTTQAIPHQKVNDGEGKDDGQDPTFPETTHEVDSQSHHDRTIFCNCNGEIMQHEVNDGNCFEIAQRITVERTRWYGIKLVAY